MKIAVFAGDGIGPEVTREAVRVLQALNLPGLELLEGDVGGAAWRKHGHPLPPQTLATAHAADAILFGAVGALAIALRTHAAAPLCGLSAVGHCPACYAALGLGLFGAAMAMAPLLARRR